MKKKMYRIEEEFPYMGDLFQTKVGGRLRPVQFFRRDRKTVYLFYGKKIISRKAEEVKAIQITQKLLFKMGFQIPSSDPAAFQMRQNTKGDQRLILDRGGMHFEAYEGANVMHIEIYPEGETRKTIVCCDFVHELQHLKRLQIAGITLPFTLNDFD